MNDSLIMSDQPSGGGNESFEYGSEDEEEERILGPLGGAGLFALIAEVLCGCSAAFGCVAMIYLGADCLIAGSEAEVAEYEKLAEYIRVLTVAAR